MLSIETILLMSAILIIAFIVKGTTGFGAGLVAMSTFLLFFDIKFVQPIFLVVQLASDIFLLYWFGRYANKKTVFLLAISSLIGVYIGTYFLRSFDSSIIRKMFAAFVILFSLKMLFFDEIRVKKPKYIGIFGSVAGFFGGMIDSLFSTGGPPIVMYLSYIKTKKQEFRATCVAMFFVFHIGRLITYSISGLFTYEVMKIGLLLCPAMIIGSLVGMRFHKKVDERLFKRIVAVILILISVMLFF
ncbi:MAG: sulfite exporter TauE/SafE family protein [Nanoarchaeota archaeon]|nr:sulfite exporter TauE/SafE family protein [Nanoarchaeota archaeon]